MKAEASTEDTKELFKSVVKFEENTEGVRLKALMGKPEVKLASDDDSPIDGDVESFVDETTSHSKVNSKYLMDMMMAPMRPEMLVQTRLAVGVHHRLAKNGCTTVK